MNKNTPHAFIAKAIAEEISRSGVISVQDIEFKVKMILKNLLFDKHVNNEVVKLRTKQLRQAKALQRHDLEKQFWYNKYKDLKGNEDANFQKVNLEMKLINQGLK